MLPFKLYEIIKYIINICVEVEKTTADWRNIVWSEILTYVWHAGLGLVKCALLTYGTQICQQTGHEYLHGLYLSPAAFSDAALLSVCLK